MGTKMLAVPSMVCPVCGCSLGLSWKLNQENRYFFKEAHGYHSVNKGCPNSGKTFQVLMTETECEEVADANTEDGI